ncbi:MAG: 50S ribosomal protein L23 [Conexivisphaerales archaeon]
MLLEDAYKIVQLPYVTEKTFALIEKENKMVFLVSDKATKRKIKEAIELLYNVKVVGVDVMRVPKGKKAYVTLSPETPASELASRIGVL